MAKRGPKPKGINPKSGERLEKWITEAGLTKTEAARATGDQLSRISNIIHSQKPLGYDIASRIRDNIPNKSGDRVRVEYLIGEDDFKTDREYLYSRYENALDNFINRLELEKTKRVFLLIGECGYTLENIQKEIMQITPPFGDPVKILYSEFEEFELLVDDRIHELVDGMVAKKVQTLKYGDLSKMKVKLDVKSDS